MQPSEQACLVVSSPKATLLSRAFREKRDYGYVTDHTRRDLLMWGIDSLTLESYLFHSGA